jgi:hypothetical protein
LDTLNSYHIIWVPLIQAQPMGAFAASDLKYKALSEKDRQFYKNEFRPFKGSRLSLRIHPDVSARFGFYTDPFETKVNINVDTRLVLARGLSLQTGLNIPVNNNLDNQSLKLKMAPAMLHYFSQPINNHFVSLSAGTFYNARYGLDLEYRYNDFNSPWNLGFEAGLTGFYWLNGLELYKEDMNDILAIADVEYRIVSENVSLKLSIGQFLAQDKGIRADIIKQYGNVDIGLFAARTNIGTTGGFQFAFNLFPGAIFRTKNLELRTTEEFRWEYSYNNEDPVAQRYRLGIPRLADLLRQYNVSFMRALRK